MFIFESGKVTPVLNEAPRHGDACGSRGIDPCILNLAIDVGEW
jgi:hypothetical protein